MDSPKGDTCFKHQPVKTRFHWVCGTSEPAQAGRFIGKETNFDVTVTVFEKMCSCPTAPQNNYRTDLRIKSFPRPPCPDEYLIGVGDQSAITTNGNGALIFDRDVGHYQAVIGQVIRDVRYNNLASGPSLSAGFLTLLALDVKSNRPNNPVFVALDF